MGCKKQGAKAGSLLFKRKRGPNFFQGHKPTNVFKTRIVGADGLGNCLQNKAFESRNIGLYTVKRRIHCE